MNLYQDIKINITVSNCEEEIELPIEEDKLIKLLNDVGYSDSDIKKITINTYDDEMSGLVQIMNHKLILINDVLFEFANMEHKDGINALFLLELYEDYDIAISNYYLLHDFVKESEYEKFSAIYSIMEWHPEDIIENMDKYRLYKGEEVIENYEAIHTIQYAKFNENGDLILQSGELIQLS